MIAMPKLNIQLLMDALAETEQYIGLGQSEAAKYLYQTLYIPIINDVPMRLSDFNFDNFALEDLSAFEDYYDKELNKHERQVHSLLNTLDAICPITVKMIEVIKAFACCFLIQRRTSATMKPFTRISLCQGLYLDLTFA